MRQFNMVVAAALTCASLTVGGCAATSKVGDEIDAQCEMGTLALTQAYVDNFNDYLAGKGRKFRIDGITCLE